MAFIYIIKNKNNGKIYVGKTNHTNPSKRWEEHKKDYKKSRNVDRPFYKAMKKHGKESFEFIVIEEIANDALACEREQYWIRFYRSYVKFEDAYGYNATLGGDGRERISERINDEEVCKLYTEDKYPMCRIGEMLGIDEKTVKVILERNDITIRPYNEILPVFKIDPITDEVLARYNSLKEAMAPKERGWKHISEACNGKRKTSGGFKWEYDRGQRGQYSIAA